MRNLSRVLSGTINGASEVPDPGVRLTRGLGPATGKTTSRAVPLPFFTPLRRRAAPSGTDLIINVLIAGGQFQRDLQNELTAEGVAAAEAEGRYRGRRPALSGDLAEEVRAAYRDQGASIAALARAHGVSRAAVRTALALKVPPLP